MRQSKIKEGSHHGCRAWRRHTGLLLFCLAILGVDVCLFAAAAYAAASPPLVALVAQLHSRRGSAHLCTWLRGLKHARLARNHRCGWATAACETRLALASGAAYALRSRGVASSSRAVVGAFCSARTTPRSLCEHYYMPIAAPHVENDIRRDRLDLSARSCDLGAIAYASRV